MAVNTGEDDGLREINLSGKQMFFLFMAATTVLVVAFMLGMLVGRGVRAEREDVASAETLTAPAPNERNTPSLSDEIDPRKAAPPAPAENGDAKADKSAESNEEPPVAVKRDSQMKTDAAKAVDTASAKPADASKATSAKVAEPTKPSAAEASKTVAAAKKPAETAAPAAAKAVTPPAKPEPAPVAKAPAAEPAPAPSAASAERAGFAVQVAAVKARGEADAIVKRLSGKGYPAYVEVPRGSASTFRVRVGTYDTRHQAQDIADKLKKDENFKPWVTR